SCICVRYSCCCFFFSFSYVPSTAEIYTLSLHDALPISRFYPLHHHTVQPRRRAARRARRCAPGRAGHGAGHCANGIVGACNRARSEEHTSELQSRENLVCRLLLEKKKTLHPDEKTANIH